MHHGDVLVKQCACSVLRLARTCSRLPKLDETVLPAKTRSDMLSLLGRDAGQRLASSATHSSTMRCLLIEPLHNKVPQALSRRSFFSIVATAHSEFMARSSRHNCREMQVSLIASLLPVGKGDEYDTQQSWIPPHLLHS